MSKLLPCISWLIAKPRDSSLSCCWFPRFRQEGPMAGGVTATLPAWQLSRQELVLTCPLEPAHLQEPTPAAGWWDSSLISSESKSIAYVLDWVITFRQQWSFRRPLGVPLSLGKRHNWSSWDCNLRQYSFSRTWEIKLFPMFPLSSTLSYTEICSRI